MLQSLVPFHQNAHNLPDTAFPYTCLSILFSLTVPGQVRFKLNGDGRWTFLGRAGAWEQ